MNQLVWLIIGMIGPHADHDVATLCHSRTPRVDAVFAGQRTGRMAAAAQPGAEPHDQLEQVGADGGAVQGVLIEAVVHARRGGQGAGNDGARVDAAGTVGGQAAGLPAQQALHR